MFYRIEVVVIVEIATTTKLIVALAYAQANLLPCDTVDLLDTLLREVVVQGFVGTYAIHGIGQGVDVPVVDLDDIVQDFAATGLL